MTWVSSDALYAVRIQTITMQSIGRNEQTLPPSQRHPTLKPFAFAR